MAYPNMVRFEILRTSLKFLRYSMLIVDIDSFHLHNNNIIIIIINCYTTTTAATADTFLPKNHSITRAFIGITFCHMATSTSATMETPKWSTWANTTRSTKFLELHDLIVNRSLSPAHGPMTSADLNHIIKTIHKNMLRKNPNIAQDVHNYLLERNVWRYCCE